MQAKNVTISVAKIFFLFNFNFGFIGLSQTNRKVVGCYFYVEWFNRLMFKLSYYLERSKAGSSGIIHRPCKFFLLIQDDVKVEKKNINSAFQLFWKFTRVKCVSLTLSFEVMQTYSKVLKTIFCNNYQTIEGDNYLDIFMLQFDNVRHCKYWITCN